MAGNVRWVRYELGRYVATEIWFELGRYVATELRLELVCYRAPAQARSLRSDRAEWAFGRYVATELWLELGCYVATERSTRLVSALVGVTASELGLFFSQPFLFVPIEDFLLFCHWFVKRRAFPSESASGPSWMSVGVFISIVGDIASIQVDLLDSVVLRSLRGRRSPFGVSLFDGRLLARVANIFLNSSSAAALAGGLAADTSAAGVWRSVPLPPLRGLCTLSVSLVDMSG
ncbi:hypothetical protein F2Q69_00005401 [Brassica cretica]|uniref:Uncharacterized protein n=1 Tax=Brassica cretica TaxID=69181 RepID=A0A8S9NUM6_BRACR|nr:hypothetical protein F2Q69_00005401 [Brassica cretica]